MDVRQLALLASQPSAAVKPREHFCGMPKRGLAFILANALFWQPLLAQADGIVVSAPGTSLGQAGNGVPIVNIAAPNASGLSHNQFHDYNVGANGVILNNATNRIQSTQLGGIILGNPNLNGAAAQTILNEVNGGSPSQLRGYTEVAGQSARVIVANPHGISCNGCGFINTPRVTLTTGKPLLDNGRLDRFQVDQGSVSIDGLGLDASSVDSFEIITRSAKINAQINARSLTIVAGRNDVNADNLNATARADDGSAKPELAIDSSALGGMYAGAIKLVGTEAGVGVKLDGTLAASGGDIQLDANGHLSMAQAAASGAINVKAASLDSTGPVYAGTRLDMQTSDALNNQHNLVARDSVTLTSAGQLTNNGIIEAGVNADNSRNTTGDVNLSAQNLKNTGKSVIASRNLTATATQTLTNRGGTLSAQQQTKLTVSTLDNQGGSLLGSAIVIDFGSATGDLNNSAGLITTAGQLSISHLRDLNNQQGEISSSQSFTLAGRTLDNSAGKLVSNNVLALDAVSLLNQRGLASGWQGLTVSGGSLDNRNSGTLSSRYGDIGVSLGGALLNSGAGALVSQKALIVNAANLDNSAKGILSSGAGQTLIIGGLLNNAQGGSIDSGAGLQLTAARLDNAKGTVQSQKGLNLDISGDLDNQSGVVTAQTENLILKAANADNRGGALLSLKGLLQTRIVGVLRNGYDLNNNRQGGIIQAQLLDLQALRGIDNYGGSITAQSGDAIVNTGTGDFDNRNGGLYAKQRVSVTGNDFDNSGDNDGQIAGQRITLDLSGALNNRLGIIESDSSLSITAASLDNQSGQLRALGASGKTEFQIGGLFDNRKGILETANTDLTLAAGSFQNVGGSLLHVGIGTFAISLPNVTGAGGSIVTRGGLTLEGDNATNSSVIQAGRLTVNVDNFNQTTDGQLLASDSFTGTGIRWRNDGVIASGGDTTITVAGLFSNYGRLTSAANLGLTAGSVGNYGTLGSAQDLTVTTGALLNDHALIFSSGDMSLRVDTLTNSYAGIYSLGNLSIDRDGQGAQAASIVNSSASIQSDGSMSLAASTIQNIRAVLTTNDQGIYTASITELRCIEGYNAGDCSGGKENHVWQILQRDKFEVTAASAASSITAGGNLSITGADLLNQSSTIATGGNLTASLNNLSNSGIETGETETTRVFRSERTRDPESWIDAANAFTHKYWYQSAGYTPNDLGGLEAAMSRFIGRTERELTQFASSNKLSSDDQSYAAVIQAAGTVNITAQNNFDNSVVRPGYNYVGSGPRTDTTTAGTHYSTRITLNQQLPPDLAQQQVNPLTLPGFSLPTGQNGLFRLSAQGSTSTDTTPQGWTLGLPASTGRSAPNKYLIETNPALTDLKQFMSSDYLLKGLGYDPDNSAKRLGDGFYEQRLIQQAVVARTGQRLLAGQTTDEALFKYLMNNAIASKQQLDLALGVALTAEQVAALTHDIVWLENQQVNGEQVLVPVLYLAQANNRLAANGALIQGRDVSLIAGKDLNNAGTLRAGNNLSGIAGNDLLNRGLVEAGNRLDLLASNNLVNKAGGIIAGRDVGLIAVNGDVINERTVTTHTSGSGYRSERTDFVDSAARIEAANDLTLRAGRDFNNSGGVLKSGADTTIDADRDVNIISAEQLTNNIRGTNNRNQTITQHGSSIDVGRDLTINAGRNLTAIGSQIDARRDIDMNAVGDLTLASAADEQHSYSKSKKVTSQEDHASQIATAVTAGGSVVLNAGKDMTLISSRVSARDEAYLFAKGKLELLAAQDSDYSLYDMKKKGGWGSKQTQRDEVTQVTHIGSEIKTGGDLLLVSGGDQRYQVAKLESGGDITLDSGGAITFEGGKDLHQESHEKSKSDLAWTSAKGKGNTDETVRQTQLVAQGDLVIKAVDGLHIDIKQINQKTVSQTIDAMVQADPQLAWLKEAEQRGDVDWRLIKETHESFKYSHSSLGQGAMLAIIIIVTVLTAGAASAVVGAAGSAVGAGSTMAAATAGTAATATAAATAGTAAGLGNVIAATALTSMASTGAVSVINNKGSIGAALKETFSSDSLKSAAVSGLTAGALQYADINWFSGAGQAGSTAVKGVSPTTSSTLQVTNSSKDIFQWSSAGNIALRTGGRAVISSGISTAVNGGNFEDNFNAALLGEAGNVAMATGFNWVGDTIIFPDGSAQKILAHAIMGGLLAEATGSDFKMGAAAAGLNEALINQMATVANGSSDIQLMLSQLTGLLAAATVDGDLEKGAQIAQKATTFNYLYHHEVEKMLREVDSKETEQEKVAVRERYAALDMQRNDELDALCNRSPEACRSIATSLVNDDQKLTALIGELRAQGKGGAAAAVGFIAENNLSSANTIAADLASNEGGALTQVGAAAVKAGVGIVPPYKSGGAKGSASSKTSVQELEVGSYQNLKSKEVVGDGLEHDHIPSFAALRTAKEADLGRPLTEMETKALYQNSTAVEVPRDVHVAGTTYGGKNTPAQIQRDAADLCGAVCRDTDALRANLTSRGYDSKLVDKTIQAIVERNRQTGVIK